MFQLSLCLGDREHTMATVLSAGVSVWEDSSVVENLPSKCKAPGISSSAHQTPKYSIIILYCMLEGCSESRSSLNKNAFDFYCIHLICTHGHEGATVCTWSSKDPFHGVIPSLLPYGSSKNQTHNLRLMWQVFYSTSYLTEPIL